MGGRRQPAGSRLVTILDPMRHYMVLCYFKFQGHGCRFSLTPCSASRWLRYVFSTTLMHGTRCKERAVLWGLPISFGVRLAVLYSIITAPKLTIPQSIANSVMLASFGTLFLLVFTLLLISRCMNLNNGERITIRIHPTFLVIAAGFRRYDTPLLSSHRHHHSALNNGKGRSDRCVPHRFAIGRINIEGGQGINPYGRNRKERRSSQQKEYSLTV